MPRHVLLRAAATLVLVAGTSSIARADITAFIGTRRTSNTTLAPTVEPDTSFRLDKGLAVGFGLVIVGFEFEWSKTDGDSLGDNLCAGTQAACAPSLTTGMGNVLLQTPHGVLPLQIYGTIGAGGYRERFEVADQNHYGFGTNVGGGVKIDLVGPLRLRLDYRIFKLANDAVTKSPQRFYAGATLAF
jgi:opacity protein-like surface antigen